ncbi:CHAT domain-containing protein [Archangium sp.]|uniref:CHAT domain-containing protein n=1 Tax=Archangium sp. TaxID=1872627 RepID=UPI00286A6D4E|nr:CHAT domain-containing protein [Archangium sp.]
MTSLTTHPLVAALRKSSAPGPHQERERFRLLFQFLPSMPPEEMRGVVQCVQRFGDAKHQLHAIRKLTTRVPGGLLLPLVDVVLKRDVPTLAKERDDTLRSLRPVLSPLQWDEAFGRVRGREKYAERSLFLVELSRRLSKKERLPFLEQALLIAERTPPEAKHSLELEKLVRGLSGPSRFRVRPLLETIPSSLARARAIAAWAETMTRRSPPRLQDLEWALGELGEYPRSRELPPLEERVTALAWMAYCLPSRQLPEALDLTRTVENDQFRIPLRMALAVRLPKARRRPLFEESLQRLRWAAPNDRAQVLEAVSSYLYALPLELHEEAWELALASAERPPIEALRSLLRHTPPEDQERRWVQLLDRSHAWEEQKRWLRLSRLSRALEFGPRARIVERWLSLPDTRERALALAAFSRTARHRTERQSLREWAVAALSSIESTPQRERTLQEITSFIAYSTLVHMLPVEVFPQVASPRKHASRAPVVGDVEQAQPSESMDKRVLSRLSEEERASVLRQMIRELGEGPQVRDTPPERVVNLGFSEPTAPEQELAPHLSLRPSRDYLFWFEVGGPVEWSITDAPTRLPTEHLPADAILTVALFGFEEELEVYPEHDVGQLRLRANGQTSVEQHSKKIRVDSAPGRLFFPVRTPSRPGTFRLRCNIHHDTSLLQSWLIRVEVSEVPEERLDALRATQDFVYSRVLEPPHLHQIPAPGLALMLNGTEDSSHLFVFGDDVKEPLSFDTAELKRLVEDGRNRLAEATWGKPRPWNGGDKYLYGGGLDPKRLLKDLTQLARVGWGFYSVLIGRLPALRRKKLRELFARPSSVQLALKESPQAVFPLALVYDYNIDSQQPLDQFTLCPDFLAALRQNLPLGMLHCFSEGCPHRGKGLPSSTICPSGFWGFRHELGLTLSAPHLLEPPTHIPYANPRHVAVGLSSDERLTHRDAHVQKLRTQHTDANWDCRETRNEVLELLRNSQPHLVYFYCNGGLTQPEGHPYIRVGDSDEPGITRDNLVAYSIEWAESRPLVFINGCHTTALEPEIALNLVSGFIENAQASGVVGTEITVFEETARTFAEHCLQGLFEGDTIGRAVRDARRALLQQGNPLGLVYIPFVLPGLRFDAAPMTPALRMEVPAPIPA